MTKLFHRLRQENGLTLVELLAGLFLFSTVITMLYGVLYSGYSLKNKVTQQTTIRNHADVLVNSVLLSLRNVDEVVDVKHYFDSGKANTSKYGEPISAIWTTQIINRGTSTQTRVSFLYQIVPDGTPASGSVVPQRYRLLKETFSAPIGTYLDFKDTNYFIDGHKSADKSEQISDQRFPLLDTFTDRTGKRWNGSRFSLDYKDTYDLQDVIDITFTLFEYKNDETEPIPFEFQSRVNIN